MHVSACRFPPVHIVKPGLWVDGGGNRVKVKGHVLSPLSSISQNGQEEETINMVVRAVYRRTGCRGDGVEGVND